MKRFLCILQAAPVVSTAVFVGLTLYLLNTNSRWSVVIYVCLLWLVLAAARPLITAFVRRQNVAYAAVALGTYWFYAGAIGGIELWGDEVGVINIVSLPFGEIVGAVSRLHAAAPPLDYWNLWIWTHVAYPLKPVMEAEVFYRMPYMIIHTVSATLFAYLVSQGRVFPKKQSAGMMNRYARASMGLVSFLAYFVNPILFLYSIEVRYFALIPLGFLVTVWLWQTDRLTDLRFFPLLAIFYLNSVVHFIVTLPFLVVELRRTVKCKDMRALYPVAGSLTMMVLIWPRLLFPEPVSAGTSLKLVVSGARSFISLQLPNAAATLGAAILLAVSFGTTRKRHLPYLAISAFYMIAMSASSIYKGYFDFSFRHYISSVGPLLFSMLSLLDNQPKTLKTTVTVIAGALVLGSWVGLLHTYLTGRWVPSKALYGTKAVFDYTQEHDLQVVYVQPPEDHDPLDTAFRLSSFEWYAGENVSVFVREISQNKVCAEAWEPQQNTAFYSVYGNIDCLHVSHHEAIGLYGAVLYVPRKSQ